MHAQESAKKFRIGFLDTGQSVAVPKLLTDLGYIDGQNAVFEHRASQAQPERAAEMAADLVQRKVDVIVAFTNVNAFAAKQATSTIPTSSGLRTAHSPQVSFPAWRARPAT